MNFWKLIIKLAGKAIPKQRKRKRTNQLVWFPSIPRTIEPDSMMLINWPGFSFSSPVEWGDLLFEQNTGKKKSTTRELLHFFPHPFYHHWQKQRVRCYLEDKIELLEQKHRRVVARRWGGEKKLALLSMYKFLISNLSAPWRPFPSGFFFQHSPLVSLLDWHKF